jgi:L-alanine-DL-glutamate epimerase-like enolase superfamily enzyme
VTRQELQALRPHGGARCALDCALWDLEAKRAGVPAHVLAGLPAPKEPRMRFGLPSAVATLITAWRSPPRLVETVEETPSVMADRARRVVELTQQQMPLRAGFALQMLHAELLHEDEPDDRGAQQRWRPRF